MSIDKKVREWNEAGLLDEATGQKLVDYEHKKLAGSDKREHKPPILVIIGSILLALSLFSFVAANWQVIPDLVKVSIFLVFMLGMYAAAERFQVKAPQYVTLFRVLGIVFFIATMIVIFTTYNLSSQLPLLFWLFFAVAVLHKLIYKHPIFTFIAALAIFLAVTNSFQGIGITLILLGLLFTWIWFHYGDNELDRIFAWFGFYGLLISIGEYTGYEGRFWPLWALVVLHVLFLLYRERAQWNYLYLFVAAVLSLGYLINATEGWLSQRQPSIIEATILSVALVAVYLTHRQPELMWVSLLAVIPFSLFEDSGILLAVLLEAVALAFLVYQDQNQKPIVLAFIYFLLVQMTIYFIYVWDRLDISLFFLIGALIVFALSLALWWRSRSRSRGDAQT